MKIFDLCGTLFNSNTTFDFVRFCFPKRSAIIFSLPIRVLGKLSKKLLGYDLIRKLAISSFRGSTKEEIALRAELFYEQILKYKKVSEIFQLLEENKSNEVVIVSASIEPVVKVVGKKLKVKSYISSELECTEGVYTGKLSKDTLGNKSKFLSDSIDEIELVVTDNKSDMDLVRLSKKALLVTKTRNVPFWLLNKLPQDSII